ncbi:hypothetical protein O23A_p4524 [Aeromonas salmonicida]|nr:hypothetical protein O23A_p4524 [Aeromonas salmonicida]
MQGAFRIKFELLSQQLINSPKRLFIPQQHTHMATYASLQ